MRNTKVVLQDTTALFCANNAIYELKTVQDIEREKHTHANPRFLLAVSPASGSKKYPILFSSMFKMRKYEPSDN